MTLVGASPLRGETKDEAKHSAPKSLIQRPVEVRPRICVVPRVFGDERR